MNSLLKTVLVGASVAVSLPVWAGPSSGAGSPPPYRPRPTEPEPEIMLECKSTIESGEYVSQSKPYILYWGPREKVGEPSSGNKPFPMTHGKVGRFGRIDWGAAAESDLPYSVGHSVYLQITDQAGKWTGFEIEFDFISKDSAGKVLELGTIAKSGLEGQEISAQVTLTTASEVSTYYSVACKRLDPKSR